jgi:hypothetical protein
VKICDAYDAYVLRFLDAIPSGAKPPSRWLTSLSNRHGVNPMKIKFAGALVAIVAMGWLSWSSRDAAVRAQDNSANKPIKSDELHQAQINYAKALLKVAEADLAKADEANKKVAGAIPPSVIFGLRNDVAIWPKRV